MKTELKLTRWILATVFILLTGLAVLFGCTPETVEEKRVVTFMNGGDVFDVQEVDLGEKYEFPAERPTREQPDDEHICEFVGWTLDPNYYEYRSEILTEPDYVVGDLTIYAAYRTVAIAETPDGGADLEYSVEFRMPRGDDFGSYSGKTLSRQTVKRYGSAALPSASDMPVIKGYHFTGAWEGGTLTDVRGNRRVTAVYEKNTYTYSWHYLDEQSSREVAFREPIDLDEQPEVESAFVFDGWFMDEARTIPATLSEAPAEDIDLYAKYHVDFSTASVSHEGNMVYGDDMNKLYVSGLSYADGLNYTFVWTVNNERGDLTEISNYPVKNAGIYNVSVHIYADYHNGVLKDEGDARNENSSTALVFTLEKATLSATVTLNTHSVVYGEEPPAASIEYSGFEFDETAEEVGVGEDFLFMQGDVNVTGNLHAGTYSVKTVPHELQNYKFAEIAAPSFTVEKKNLTVTMSVDNYTYGAGFAPEISFSDDFVYGEGEDVLGEHWFVLNGGSPATKRAGSAGSDKYTEGDILHAGDHVVELKGFGSGDYQVHLPGEEQFSVAKRKASATLSAVGGVYGVSPSITYTFTDVLEDDRERFTPSYTYKRGGNPYSSTDRFIVGEYSVDATFIEDGSDYEPLEVKGAEFSVEKKALSVSVRVDGTYEYGALISPVAVYADGFEFGESADTDDLVHGKPGFTYRTAADGKEYVVNRPAVDKYTVEANGITADNYNFIFPKTEFEVVKKQLILTVHLAENEILYGKTPVAATADGYYNGVSYNGFVDGEDVLTVFGTNLPEIFYEQEGVQVSEFHAGEYTATTSADPRNYAVEVETVTLTVNPRSLYVGISLSEQSLEYGKKPSASIYYDKEGYDGFFTGEQNKYTAGAYIEYKGETTYTQSDLSPSSTKMVAGKYALSVTGISEDIVHDYEVTYQHDEEPVGFEITPKKLTATIGKDKEGYTYGEKPVLTLTFAGWAYSENVSDLFDDDGSHIVIGDSVYDQPAILGAGDYTATLAESQNKNYTIEVTEATFTVGKKELTVKVSVENIEYGQDPEPVVSYDGFITGENEHNLSGELKYSYSGELSSSSHYRAGENTLTLSGYESENYDITYQSVTFNISPIEITLTTKAGWSTYADDRESAAEDYWYSVSGGIIEDELTFSLSITRDGEEYTHGSDKYYPAGSYKVSVEFEVNSDYIVKHNGETVSDGEVETEFTVAKKNATINFSGSSKWDKRESWSFTPTNVVDSRFEFSGVIVLKDAQNTNADTYNDTEIDKTFKWLEEPVIKLADSITDVTNNFEFVYTLKLTLDSSDFSISVPEGLNAQFTYDKQAHKFEITASAEGVEANDISIQYKTEQSAEYAGEVPTFTDAGDYTVYYKVSADNCNDSEGSFTVKGNRAKLTVPTAGKNTFTYNTELQTYTPDSYDEETMDIANNTFTDVPEGGSQTATVSIADKKNYEWTDGKQNDIELTFTVNKAVVTVPQIAHKTYSGENQTAEIAESELYSITANEGGKNAGEYDVKLTLSDINNYKWSNGDEQAEITLQFVIDKVKLEKPTAGTTTFTYNAKEQTYTPENYDEETMNIAGNTFTDVPAGGSQTATVSIADTTNYEWKEGGQNDLTFTITVAKADYTVTAVDQTYTYNSREQGDGISVSGVEGELNFSAPQITYICGDSSGNTAPKFTNYKSGGYTVNYSIEETPNYNQKSGSYTIIINKATPVLESYTDEGNYVYNKSVQVDKQTVYNKIVKENVYSDATVEYSLNGNDYSETFPEIKNAETYNIRVRVSGDNYLSTGVAIYTVTVSPKPVAVSLPDNISGTYNGEVYGGEGISTSLDTDEDLTKIADVKYEVQGVVGTTPTAPTFIDATAKTTVTVTVTSIDSNYTFGDNGIFTGTYTVSIAKASLSVNVTDKTVSYSGKNQFEAITAEQISGLVQDDDYSITYSREEAGKYSEKLSIVNVNDSGAVWYKIDAGNNYNVCTGSFNITIFKIELTQLPDDVKAPSIENEIIRRAGRTLDSVCPLDANWSWETEVKGDLIETDYNLTAIYDDPSGNYMPYRHSITFTTRKEQIEVEFDGAPLETEYGVAFVNESVLEQFTFEGEEAGFEVSGSGITLELSGHNVNLGNTYLGSVKFNAESEYFELTETTFEVIIKVKAVEVDGTLYTIEDALNTAESGGTIIVKHNASFAEKSIAEKVGYSGQNFYTIKQDVKLLLPYNVELLKPPYDKEDGLHANNKATESSFGKSKKLELTIPANITLINNGKILIGGITTGQQKFAGGTGGDYAQITMGQNAKIDSYGDITAYGFIVESTENNGSQVTMNSGTLLMPFIVVEHRGGSVFYGCYRDLKGLPFNSFYLQNVTAKLTITQSASLSGHANLFASGGDHETDIKLVGQDSDALISLTDASSELMAKYNIQSAVIDLDIYGNFTLNSMSLTIPGLDATITTAGVLFPVSWHYNIGLHAFGDSSAATVTATEQSLKLMPGASLKIDTNVTVNATDIIVYDSDYQAKKVGAGVLYQDVAPKGEDGKMLIPAKLVVNGVLRVRNIGGKVDSEADSAVLTVSETTSVTSYELASTVGSGLVAKVTWETYTRALQFVDVDSPENGIWYHNDGAWKQKYYDITYNYKFGAEIRTEEGIDNPNPAQIKETATIDLKIAQCAGWSFIGWYTDPGCTEENRIESIVGSRGAITIYGLFETADSYVIKYQTNDENITIDDETVLAAELDSFNPSENSKITVYDHDPHQIKYFGGWYLDEQCSIPFSAEAVRAKGPGVGVAVTLYAKWADKVKLNIEFTAVNITIGDEEYVYKDPDITLLPNTFTLYFKPGETVKITLTKHYYEGLGMQFDVKTVEIHGAEWTTTPEGDVKEGQYSFTMPGSEVSIKLSGLN